MVVHLGLAFDPTLTIAVPGQTDDPTTLGAALAARSGLGKPVLQPLVTEKGTTSYVLNRVPSSASVELPGHRPAGRFTLTFPFNDLPIDPRTVASCAVDIYLGTVRASDFAAGMRGAVNTNGTKPSVLDTSGFFGGQTNPNLLMSGLVDEWHAEHSEDGSSVTISGRDLRGILIDTPIATDPAAGEQLLDTLNLVQPIQLVIRDLLSKHPMMPGIKVRVSLSEWGGTTPIPGAGALPRHKRGAKNKNTGGKMSAAGSPEKLSYWDLVTKLCYLVGAIPQFVGSELRIRPVRSLFDQQRAGFDPANPTPFVGGIPRVIDAESGATVKPMTVRKMLYGRDIQELQFSRKFGGYQAPRQVCCVHVTPGRAMVQGKFPSTEVATRLFASGQKSIADILYVPVADICDADRLAQIAQAIYEEVGRGEVGGTCKTKKLSSFGGDNSDPDLLKLRPGDAVEFATDVRELTKTAPLVSAYTDHMRTPFEKQVEMLAGRIGDRNLARVILATARGSINEVQGFFRVSAVHYSWGEDGLAVSMDFQNFIEKTYDKDGSVSLTGGPTLDLTVPDQELGA
jgi:hypothetical protein